MKTLTKTEQKVAKLVALGLTEDQIADKLFVTKDTVHTHTYHIRKKIGARSAVDICRKYILSLENPKKLIIALGFAVMQSFMSLQADVELRKPVRSSRTRIVRVRSNRNKNNGN